MNRKNVILAGITVAIIIAIYFGFSYFGGESGGDDAKTQSGGSLEENNGIFEKMPSSINSSEDVVLGNMNLTDSTFTGKGIYDLISVLEKLNFEIEFFENEKFLKLIDFSKKVEVREEEKGNFNPFHPTGTVFVSSGAKTGTSTPR